MSDRYSAMPYVLIGLPVFLYWMLFFHFRYNVNYIAFDDVLILSILPAFTDANLYEKWKLLSSVFPEHRLIFSRTIVLITHKLFGKVDLTYLMILASTCYTICLYFFYRVFISLKLSIWYFIPIAWIWMSIQAFENIFWGVSSLCNFGVLLFGISALYYASFKENQPWKALLCGLVATFTYGNGLFISPLILLLFVLIGQYKLAFYTGVLTVFITTIYFIDFKPITQSLDFSNPEHIRQGFWGLFGFIGSVGTIAAYEGRSFFKYLASILGIVMNLSILLLFKSYPLRFFKAFIGTPVALSRAQRFILVLALFVFITALATTFKRIPNDTFDGMFKGRYRMYSVLTLICAYIGYLATWKKAILQWFIRLALPGSILFWFIIAYFNIPDIINNQREAITQEFNARYNADWVGLGMFNMDQEHFEKIRSYYQSDDPLKGAWIDSIGTTPAIPCKGQIKIDSVLVIDDHLYIKWQEMKNNSVSTYENGQYIILKSEEHMYAIHAKQRKRPFFSFLKDGNYLHKEQIGILHTGAIQPGQYYIYVLDHVNKQNTIYCTGLKWTSYE